MSANPPGKITFDEILAKFPQLMDLFSAVQEGVASAQADGKLTGAEVGDLLAVVGPKLGRLVDAVIEDAKD